VPWQVRSLSHGHAAKTGGDRVLHLYSFLACMESSSQLVCDAVQHDAL